MTKKLLMGLLVVVLAFAAAKTYTLTFSDTMTVAGTELKAGNYRLSLDADKAVISNGKQSVESPVKVEQSPTKFGETAVRYARTDGKSVLQEVELGGTTTKLVFSE
jgi:hypothetical protein